MGAAGSSILGADGEWGETSLGDMPESCVAAVLLYLDPPEICQVARLNRAFRGAASADCVWAAKLPANYRYLAALAAAADDEGRGDADANGKRFSLAATKKEIYARLCRSTLFDAGTKLCSPRCCASPEPPRVASPCWSGARARFFSQLRRSIAVRYLAVARLPLSISSPPVSRFYSVLLPWCSSVISTVQGRPERHHRFVGARRRDAINDDELPLPRFHPNHRAEPHAEFWILKDKGSLCISISSKAMTITGIDDRRYWSHLATEESRFHSVAYLQQIWWLEVDGELEFCFPAGAYSVFFHLYLGRPYRRMGRRLCGTEHVHGWDVTPTRFQLTTSDEQQATSEYYLHLHEQGGWKLYHVGDFVVSDSDEPIKLKFSMMQIDCTHTKGGLCVDSVFIYPKGYKPEKANIVCT